VPKTRKKSVRKLHQKFADRHRQAVKKLMGRHRQLVKYLQTTEVPVGQVRDSATWLLSAGALSGALLLGPAVIPRLEPPYQVLGTREQPVANTDSPDPRAKLRSTKALVQQLQKVLPPQPRALDKKQEQNVERILRNSLGINASAELDGNRLNTSYGYMGFEQHLRRYPGDDVSQHGSLVEVGMASKNGAWGLFSSSKQTMTPEQEQMERYYFAVQTFISPGWQERIGQLKDWFKYRKMIAVNPKTGQAVVGVVADAGPAVWTGKHFGGSPEVMQALSLDKGRRYGEVVLFFVDDPENKVPLGPVN